MTTTQEAQRYVRDKCSHIGIENRCLCVHWGDFLFTDGSFAYTMYCGDFTNAGIHLDKDLCRILVSLGFYHVFGYYQIT